MIYLTDSIPIILTPSCILKKLKEMRYIKIAISSKNGRTIVVKYTVEFALISMLYWHYF